MSEQAIYPGPAVALNPAAAQTADAAPALPSPAASKSKAGQLGSWTASVLLHTAVLLCIAVFAPTLSRYMPTGSLDGPRTIAPLALSYETVAPTLFQPSPPRLQPEDVELEILASLPLPALIQEEPEAETLQHAEPPAVESRSEAASPAASPAWSACDSIPTEFQWKRTSGGGSSGNRVAAGGGAGGPEGQGTGLLGAGSGAGSGNGSGLGGTGASGFGQGLGYGRGNGQGIGNGTGNGVGAAPRGPTREVRVTKELAPVYPESERQAGRTASVLLEIQIDAQGKPVAIDVLSKEAPEAFIRSAVAAAKSARFEPALEDGRPVPGQVRRNIVFRLK